MIYLLSFSGILFEVRVKISYLLPVETCRSQIARIAEWRFCAQQEVMFSVTGRNNFCSCCKPELKELHLMQYCIYTMHAHKLVFSVFLQKSHDLIVVSWYLFLIKTVFLFFILCSFLFIHVLFFFTDLSLSLSLIFLHLLYTFHHHP